MTTCVSTITMHSTTLNSAISIGIESLKSDIKKEFDAKYKDFCKNRCIIIQREREELNIKLREEYTNCSENLYTKFENKYKKRFESLVKSGETNNSKVERLESDIKKEFDCKLELLVKNQKKKQAERYRALKKNQKEATKIMSDNFLEEWMSLVIEKRNALIKSIKADFYAKKQGAFLLALRQLLIVVVVLVFVVLLVIYIWR